MNLLRSAFLLSFVLYAHCETTQVPDDVTDSLFRSQLNQIPEDVNVEEREGDNVDGEEAQPVQLSIASEDMPSQFVQPLLVNAQPVVQPVQPIGHPEPHFVPQAVPMNPSMAGNMPVNMAQPALSPFQRQVPPFFGNPFRPSIIRNQGSNFVALPPKDQPAFDSFLCQQESNSKRDLEKRSPQPRHLEQFFLNTKNQDIIFSICGNLMPAHLLVIESISEKFEKKISTLKEKTNNEPIVINDIADLLAQSNANENENNATASPMDAPKCPNNELVPAFRSFLKFFYVGNQAFDEIDNLDVAFLVWKLGYDLLDMSTLESIETHIGKLISADNLAKVYRFIKANQIASLNKRWSEYITSHSRILSDPDTLPLSCDQINGDIEYLDRYIEALNVNQSVAIGYIRQYLRICPESANFAPVTGVNPFPRSLLYFRCTIDDLKELVKMGFISYENLADELEGRLRAKERHCEEKCMPKFVPMGNPTFRHVAPFNAGASFSTGRRA